MKCALPPGHMGNVWIALCMIDGKAWFGPVSDLPVPAFLSTYSNRRPLPGEGSIW